MFIVILASGVFSFGVANPNAPHNIFLTLKFSVVGFTSVANYELNMLRLSRNFKEIDRTRYGKFVVFLFLIVRVGPGSQTDAIFETWARSHSCVSAFDPVISIASFSRISTQKI
jgi:hypothetical protein